MDDDRKKYMEKLRNKNKEYQERIRLQNNQLLQECLQVLGDTATTLLEQDKNLVYQQFVNKTPFGSWGIEWNEFNNSRIIKNPVELLELCKNNNFYIIWGKHLPIIKSSLDLIVKNIDDIVAVEVDTWLISFDYNEIVEFNHEGKTIMGEL